MAGWKVGLVWFGMACPPAHIWQQAHAAPVASLCEPGVLAGGDWLFSWSGFLQSELVGLPEPVQSLGVGILQDSSGPAGTASGATQSGLRVTQLLPCLSTGSVLG